MYLRRLHAIVSLLDYLYLTEYGGGGYLVDSVTDGLVSLNVFR